MAKKKILMIDDDAPAGEVRVDWGQSTVGREHPPCGIPDKNAALKIYILNKWAA